MAYGTDLDADAYHAERGNLAWGAMLGSDRTAARVRASDYIRLRFVLPNRLADDDPRVIEATYIASGMEASQPGYFSKFIRPGEDTVLVEVDGIKWERVGGGDYGGRHALPASLLIETLFGRSPGMGIGFRVI